ncbi:MAG: hypothetical protein WC519_02675 [Parcubacteria group bacterium]
MIEKEFKFKIDNVKELFKKIDGVRPEIFYCKDEIFGKGLGYEKEKIRKRTIISQKGTKINYEGTKLLKVKNVNRVRENTLSKIPVGFALECSYDKVRFLFKREKYEITIDIYAFGIFCEIEGEEKTIKRIAKKLGFKIEDNIQTNIDSLYCEWAKKNKRKELYHWGFGRL